MTYQVTVPLTVRVTMDEMDSGAGATAEIAVNLIEEQVKAWCLDASVEFGVVEVKEAA